MSTRMVTATKRKLARPGPGYWLNTWWNARPFMSDVGVHHPKGKIDGHGRWPTAEIAEQKAIEWLNHPANQWVIKAGTRWLGAEFVPESRTSRD